MDGVQHTNEYASSARLCAKEGLRFSCYEGRTGLELADSQRHAVVAEIAHETKEWAAWKKKASRAKPFPD
jgi:hypothetical protein